MCGYDEAIVARLSPQDGRFFVVGAVLSLVAAFVPALSMAYGATLTLGAATAPAFFVVVAAFVLNLLRLHHAGSGYPLHHPLEHIDRWRPAGAAVVVLFVLGVFLTQPLVLLLLRPLIDAELAGKSAATRAVQEGLGVVDVAAPVHGLIARSHAAFEHHGGVALGLSVFFSLVVSAPTWIRRTKARAVRLYESERWIAEREMVDDAWAEHLEDVTEILKETAPGFAGRMQIHYADPPYNTRPLLFGLDPARLSRGRLSFVAPTEPIEPSPSMTSWASWAEAVSSPQEPPLRSTTAFAAPSPAPPTAPSPAPPTAPSPAPPTAPSPAPPTAPATASSSSAGETWAGHTAMGAGRMTVAHARGDVSGLVLFLTVYLEKPRDEVLRGLAQAPADAPLYKVFPEWNRLPTLLLKSAGFASEAGLAPLIAIAVDKPVEQVERRLRAAPLDKKVSAVFAPELARRLLRSDKS
jgi:hypothetical protein